MTKGAQRHSESPSKISVIEKLCLMQALEGKLPEGTAARGPPIGGRNKLTHIVTRAFNAPTEDWRPYLDLSGRLVRVTQHREHLMRYRRHLISNARAADLRGMHDTKCCL